eukprot:407493-Amorphochlora_amoeboformis.AAC.1
MYIYIYITNAYQTQTKDKSIPSKTSQVFNQTKQASSQNGKFRSIRTIPHSQAYVEGTPDPPSSDGTRGQDTLSASAANNCLRVTLRRPGHMRFIRYVASGAPGSRWDVGCEYALDALMVCVSVLVVYVCDV